MAYPAGLNAPIVALVCSRSSINLLQHIDTGLVFELQRDQVPGFSALSSSQPMPSLVLDAVHKRSRVTRPVEAQIGGRRTLPPDTEETTAMSVANERIAPPAA